MSSYEEEIYRRIGSNVRKFRVKTGISQENLSEMLGVNSKFIGHVERFERYISLKRLIQVAQLLNVKIEDLFAK